MRWRLLLWLACGALAGAPRAPARGGGGCLAAGTGILTPAGEVAVEQLRRGDAVVGLRDGRPAVTTVADVFAVQPAEFIALAAGGRTLRVTPEHPVATAPDEFVTAESLAVPAAILVAEKSGFRISNLSSLRRLPAPCPAYNLLVADGGVFFANGVLVHNKGCFLPDTDILLADGSPRKLSAVQPGDRVRAFDTANRLVIATVAAVLTHEVDEYLELATEAASVRVTPEHPFYIGGGRFKTAGALRVGDELFLCDGAGLQPQRITRRDRVRAPVRVYNLRTDAPHTVFANAFAVHNKGGGCFPAGTPVATPGSVTPIERLQPGDAVLAVDPAGRCATARVQQTHSQAGVLLALTTDAGTLLTTAEHPLRLADGRFCAAGALTPGQRISRWEAGRLLAAAVLDVRELPGEQAVFNLAVDAPHTFIAGGFVVHNKGGGGGHGGGFHGGSHGGSGGGNDPGAVIFMLVVVFVIVVAISQANKKQHADEDLDFVYPPRAVAAKADKTRKLLEFLGRQDAELQPAALEQAARDTFLKLQACWQARDYGPMEPLMLPDLYRDHCGQLAGLKRNHELNLIDQLHVERVDLVNVRYTDQPDQREFTALITARARDYYVDDRSGAFLRGDRTSAEFQEFWTFQRQGAAWRLRAIEQSRESDALKEENFVAQCTDDQLRQIYGAAAGAAGPAGPWLDKTTGTKSARIERLLNFLAQTDKLWQRPAMIERVRQVFTAVKLAEESGDAAGVQDGLFPDAAAHLAQQLAAQKARGLTVEYRNLCVRSVELILVRNFADNARDEFTARVSAHAQQIVRHANGTVLVQDDDVAPFVEFWTFGRLDNQWKLKAVLPPAGGAQATAAENVDEDSSPEQVRWYYTQTRAN